MGLGRVYDQVQLAEDFRRLGIHPGSEVLLHSSLSSIGHVEGGADVLIDALLAVVDSTQGTVLVPTLTGSAQDSPENPPLFDVTRTPCWTGRIAETLRLRPEADRSLNPTHSVAAIGANAVSLTTGHEDCWTTCGYGSPYYRLARRGGKILLLGVTLDSNTTFHTAEEIAGVSYHLQAKPVECKMIDYKGRTLFRKTMLHDWGTPRRFMAAADIFLEQGIMKKGSVGEAECFLIDSGAMLDYTVERLRKEPNWLVKR
ncbi:aminoglycoside N(3)-acetyltransferase [Paenibacillus puldeungensis]|uniref:Aminoglycoside N(3)-acetyltransferase n=2 Tax=Paenibacillus puldeungensis TaxID=696536 RepID=A0ABW3RTN4_9BACL